MTRGIASPRILSAMVVSAALVAAFTATATASGADLKVGRVDKATSKALQISSLDAPADGATTSPATCERYRGAVWFLPVFVAPGTSEVSCTVPRNAKLALNLGGIICYADQETPAELEALCEQGHADTRATQTAIVDGQEIDEFAPVATGTFKVTLSEPNPLDLPAGPRNFAYVGRNVMLSGLSPGQHDIRLIHRVEQGAAEPFDVDVTYHVTVSGSAKEASKPGR